MLAELRPLNMAPEPRHRRPAARGLFAALLLAGFGCASPDPARPAAEGDFEFLAALPPSAARPLAPPGVGTNGLTLTEAVAAALAERPELSAADREREARLAETRQAGRWQNPVATLEAENFVGTGVFDDYDTGETTLWVGQLFELGGKRDARVREAEVAATAAALDRARRASGWSPTYCGRGGCSDATSFPDLSDPGEIP